MPFEPELELPLGDADASAHWPAMPEPTTFIAPWPGADAPSPAEIPRALQRHFKRDPDAEEMPEARADEMLFALMASVPGIDAPVMFWAEPMQPLAPGELPDAEAVKARWALGVSTLLDAERPIESWHCLMRMVAEAFPRIPAVLDVNATTWHLRSQLDRYFDEGELGGPSDRLWVIHAVERGGSVWLHTHGLSRLHLPELEMLEVPKERAGMAAQLLDHIADLLLEQPAPPPGEPFVVGPGLAVTFRPWREVIRTLDAHSPGGEKDRADQEFHGGAVVCAAQPKGQFSKVWTWPVEVVDAMPDGAVYRSARTTERQAKVARTEWNAFVAAFVRSRCDDDPPAFLVKLVEVVEDETGQTVHEHSWMQIEDIDPDFSPDDVTDWRVIVGDRVLGPDDAAELESVVPAGDA